MTTDTEQAAAAPDAAAPDSIIEKPVAAADEAAAATKTAADEAAATKTAADEAAAAPKDTKESGKPEGEVSDDESVIADASDAGKQEATSYESIKTAQGVEMDSQYIENMTPFFQDMGFDVEAAQKYVDYHGELETQGVTDQQERFTKLKSEWVTAAEADTEIGGDHFTESVQAADAAVNKFGTPELKNVLKQFGLGNHPEFIRAFARVGKLMKEDSPGSLGNDPVPESILDTADLLYPNEKQTIN